MLNGRQVGQFGADIHTMISTIKFQDISILT